MKKTCAISVILGIVGLIMMIGAAITVKTYIGLGLFYLGFTLFMLELSGIREKADKFIEEKKEKYSCVVKW